MGCSFKNREWRVDALLNTAGSVRGVEEERVCAGDIHYHDAGATDAAERRRRPIRDSVRTFDPVLLLDLVYGSIKLQSRNAVRGFWWIDANANGYARPRRRER